jgi:predicted glycoside hydrolase/deacetylase ChbG (UPF0249 family)
MATMKRFIFFADDFGISPEVNRGVELAHRAGAVRLVSLMVTGNAAEEAVEITRKYPGIITGLHLHVDEMIGVDCSVWAGERCPGLSELVNRPGLRDKMLRECERQIEVYFSLGFTPTFINSHYNVHIIPPLSDLFIDLAQSHGFGFIRFSPHNSLLAHPDLTISEKDLETMGQKLASGGIRHADWFKPTFCYFYPPELSEGLTEIAFHPAWGDSEIGYFDLARLLSWGTILQSEGGIPAGI